ncbi:MAG: hypothetical protein JO252_02350, partial [Planctomycetaceae bacterium]|nr:hypothetical protein [Planctomycetaceae bacterium]
MNNYQLSVVEDGADKQVDIHVVKNAGQDPIVTVTNDNHVSFNQSVPSLALLDVKAGGSESSTSLTGDAYEADVSLTADGSGGYDITSTVNATAATAFSPVSSSLAADHPVAATAYSPVYGSLTIDHPVAAAAYSPVYGPLFGANGPSYRDVQQGQLGDCWLLASLAEVAARDPSDIRNMFTDVGPAMENGSVVELYNVRLFNNAGAPEYVTVDTELPSGGDYYDHPVNDVLWVALAEKAYAQANGAGIVTTQNVGSDSYDALNEGFGSWALKAITGKPAIDYNSINPANIASAWTAGNLIVIGTSNNPSSSYIVGDHEYAVVGY